MTTFTVAARRNQNLYRARTGVLVGPISSRFVVVAIVGALALLYLTQITKTSVFGTQLNQLKSQRDKLVSDKRDLEIEAARLQSIQSIQSSSAVKNMVSEGKPTFIQ